MCVCVCLLPGLQEPAGSGSVASLTDPVGKDSPTVSCEGDDDGVCLETRPIMTDHDRSWQNIQKGSQVELPFSKSVREHLTTWFRQWAKGTLVVGPIADCHPNTSRPWNLQNISSTQRIACTDGTTTSPTVRLASVVNTSMFGSSLEAEGNWSDWVARRKSGILWNLSWDGW